MTLKTILLGSDLHGRVVDPGNYAMLVAAILASWATPIALPVLALALMSFAPRDRLWIMRTEGQVVP